MSNLDALRSILYSKSIDSRNIRPYTGFHYNTTGNEKQNIIFLLNFSEPNDKHTKLLLFSVIMDKPTVDESILFIFFLGDLVLSTPITRIISC